MATNNNAFRTLVRSDTDLAGMMAYASYKKHKLDYCNKKISKNIELTEDDIKNFNDGITHELLMHFLEISSIKITIILDKFLKNKRDVLLSSLYNESLSILNEQKNHNENTLRSQVELQTEIKEIISNLLAQHKAQGNTVSSKVFWIGVAQNIIANVIWLLIVFLILFSLTDNTREDVYKQAQKIFLNKELPDNTKK